MIDLELEDIKLVAELKYNWKKLINKTILISGGTGFIGSFLCKVIEYRNHKYHQNTSIISLSRKVKTSTNDIKYIQQDITLPFTINEKVDYVLHLASNTHPKQYAEDPIGTILTNVYGCNNLLKIAVDNKARFLLASSVEIYGQGTEQAMSEDYSGYIDCNLARSGYNESKRVCESLMQSYRLQCNLDGVIARFSRVFGVDSKKDTKAISQFMDDVLNNKDVILKSEGKQRFSYCYIADAVSGLLKILLDGIDGEAYNVSCDDDFSSLGDYARYIAKLANKKVIFNIENNLSVSRATYALLDCSKLKKLSWEPLFTVKEGLKRTYRINQLKSKK